VDVDLLVFLFVPRSSSFDSLNPPPFSYPSLSGHAYYFLEDVYPRMTGRRPLKTPAFVKALFPPDPIDPIRAAVLQEMMAGGNPAAAADAAAAAAAAAAGGVRGVGEGGGAAAAAAAAAGGGEHPHAD
jgi:Derlin-2/3